MSLALPPPLVLSLALSPDRRPHPQHSLTPVDTVLWCQVTLHTQLILVLLSLLLVRLLEQQYMLNTIQYSSFQASCKVQSIDCSCDEARIDLHFKYSLHILDCNTCTCLQNTKRIHTLWCTWWDLHNIVFAQFSYAQLGLWLVFTFLNICINEFCKKKQKP